MTLLADNRISVDAAPVLPAPAHFARRHSRVIVALVLALVFHGSLLLSGSYARTYDAYVHIFFADHYARNWFSSWDDRWYTGFSVFSYPPGVHQSIAALSFFIGLRAAFVAVMIGAIILLVIGVYRWAMIWVSREAAGWAALALVVSSSIAETVHVFGQLPTVMSLGFLLNSLPFAYRFVRTGNRRSLIAALACVMATVACHHVTMLFGAIFFLGPVIIAALVAASRSPLEDEPDGHPARFRATDFWPLAARRIRRALPTLRRTALLAVIVVAALLIVVLPYWLYSRSDPITQVSIPHGSRDSYLVNLSAGLIFWVIPWGTTLIALPYALVRGFTRRLWPLALSLSALTLLGTGGTTFLPKLLLGPAYEILTLDRFTFWATICILPLVGLFIVSLLKGTIRAWLMANFGRGAAFVLTTLLVAAHLAFSLFSANLTQYKPFQPAAIDMTPITAFLAKDQHSQWRYLTLGFGDQMAWLSANTTAETVDGDYHSARQLPELTSRPIERLEGAKYTGVPGIGSLQQFLATPERYSLKYVFSNDTFYSPLLDASGWTDLGPLDNGIEVWERADVAPLPVAAVSQEGPLWERLLWGTLPPLSILFALVMLSGSAIAPLVQRRAVPGRRVMEARHRFRQIDVALDRALATAAARVPASTAADGGQARWQPWPSALRPLQLRARRSISRRRRRVQAALALGLLVILAGGGTVAIADGRSLTAPQVVTAYYDHLDFREFAAAYALLDHATRPAYPDYLKQLGGDSGLVASFAKLSQVSTALKTESENRAVVHAKMQYLTSLQLYEVRSTLTLQKSSGTWRIVLPAPDLTEAPDQFTSRPQVSFLQQGRRSAGTATSTVDVLDRPQLQLNDLRSLLVNGHWVVIGEVTNTDVVPADVTVQAQLRNRAGALLASWDAAQVLLHKLLPGQTSPFRIEFQSIAGTGDYGTEANGGLAQSSNSAAVPSPAVKSSRVSGPVEFDPQTITPFVLPKGAAVASVGVYARAVVASHVASPSLQVDNLTVEHSGDNFRLSGWLRNDGTVEASVPHLLLSYFDAAGRLTWVDNYYLEHSIAAQSSSHFEVVVPESQVFTDSGITATGFAGPSHGNARTIDAGLELPTVTGFSRVALTVGSFERSIAP